jgi:hypothetical protein
VLEEHKNSPDAISRFIKEIKNNWLIVSFCN